MSTSLSLLLDQTASLAECFESLLAKKQEEIPLATYRLQFHKGFTFADGTSIVPYLNRLGVSHCYASPILKARTGSTHGYDIIDHNQLNPEIGSEQEFRRLVARLKDNGMGLILDTVPNHMGIGHGDNPWWQDVLQNGRTSPFADFFDIEWDPLKRDLRNKILIPVLARPYGEELEDGKICVNFENGLFGVRYSDLQLPVDPQTIPMLFEPAGEKLRVSEGDEGRAQLATLLDRFRALPPNCTSDPIMVQSRRDAIPSLMEGLANVVADFPIVRNLIADALNDIKGQLGDTHSFDRLHRFLEAQVYRLAFWRVSAEEINYRRFFDVNDLVGLRMEDPRVFAETHKLMRRLLTDGLVSGLRIDHPDGLLNPIQYLVRLQMLYVASRCCGSQSNLPVAENGIELQVQNLLGRDHDLAREAPLRVFVEKILERGEGFPSDWPVDGTVGYEFANLLNGIFIDYRHRNMFTRLYQRVIGGAVDVETMIYESKKLILNSSLSSELNVLSLTLDEITSDDRRARDFTLSVLRNTIRETIACFPVYRTYIDGRGNVTERDRQYIRQAILCGKRRNRTIPSAAFDFLQNILLLEGNGGEGAVHGYRKHLYFTLKFQQLTGPVMAKGLEDTACYAYARFVSVNEVGGSPADFGRTVAEFHHDNQLRSDLWPDSMLTTSTHDTKRSEDVRARLNVLSEMPREWAGYVMKWRRINRPRKLQLASGNSAPDNNEEYFLYQTLVGAWPLHMDGDEDRGHFVKRIQRYMEKALQEAKVNVSWLNRDPDYIAATNAFIEEVLSTQSHGRKNLFWDSLHCLLPAVTYFGAINSLSQTLLKLAAPGLPDIYQGQELWDFSLVDPDNRRPVDFRLREMLVQELETQRLSSEKVRFCGELLHSWQDGRIKMWVTLCSLQLRQRLKDVFHRGSSYIPLSASHPRQEHLVAFARKFREQIVIAAVPRLPFTLMNGLIQAPIGARWGDSQIILPDELATTTFRNELTGEILKPTHGGALLSREIFANFPVALLASV